MFGLDIRIDPTSFWLGALTGCIFCVILFQLRSLFRQAFTFAKDYWKKFRESNFREADVFIRRDALKNAQRSHVAAPIFALEDILIQPKVLTPPPLHDQQGPQPTSEFLISSVFNYLPDFPTLAAQYPIDFLTLRQCGQEGANLLLVGPVGSGKTVALAQFVSELAASQQAAAETPAPLPLYLHVADLLSQPEPTYAQPLEMIIKILRPRLPVWSQARATTVIKQRALDGKAVFVLDGLDECSVTDHATIVQFLAVLHLQYPRIQMITTALPTYFQGLPQLGFNPVVIAPWNKADRLALFNKWMQAWQKLIAPQVERAGLPGIPEPAFLENWLDFNQLQRTPLDWTLMLWGAFSGDLANKEIGAIYNSYLGRVQPNSDLLRSLILFSGILAEKQKLFFSLSDLEQANQQLALDRVELSLPGVVEPQPGAGGKTATPVAKIYENIVAGPLLCEMPGKVYRFSHPAVAAFLIATSSDQPVIFTATYNHWPLLDTILKFSAYLHPENINGLETGLLTHFPSDLEFTMAFSQYVVNLAPNHPMRIKVLKKIVDWLLSPQVQSIQKEALLSALLSINDPSANAIFGQLLKSGDKHTRALACLAIGATQDSRGPATLTPSLSDNDDEIRRNACFALGILDDENSLSILRECLVDGDEVLRQAAAETLALRGQEGQDILTACAQSENLLVRRAVVIGLARIDQPWALKLLEDIAVQDGQWVVRSAATHAIEMIHQVPPSIPHALPEPAQTPWLVEYASKLNRGISPGEPALDILLDALTHGEPFEQVAALDYLRLNLEEKSENAVFQAAQNGQPTIQAAAYLALWYHKNARNPITPPQRYRS